MNSFDIYGISHIGLLRKRNEDNYFSVLPERQDGAVLLFVADGIGGHYGGDMASLSCCRTLLFDWEKLGGADIVNSSEAAEFLLRSLMKSNEHLYQRNVRNQNPRPMGCTALAAVVTNGSLTVVNAGDSRLYLYDSASDELQKLSEDDNLSVAQMECLGMEECGSRFITRAVGILPRLELHASSRSVSAGQKLLLCSDGLHNGVADDKIAEILKKSPDAQHASSSLIRQALVAGGRDNVTVISCFIGEI